MVSTDSLPYCGIAPADSKDYYLFSILTDEITKTSFSISRKILYWQSKLIPDVDYNYCCHLMKMRLLNLHKGIVVDFLIELDLIFT